MKPRLKDTEGLYYFNYCVSLPDDNMIRCLEYLRSAARWSAVRRRYKHHIEYMFILDEVVESYVALAFQLTTDSKIEIEV